MASLMIASVKQEVLPHDSSSSSDHAMADATFIDPASPDDLHSPDAAAMASVRSHAKMLSSKFDSLLVHCFYGQTSPASTDSNDGSTSISVRPPSPMLPPCRVCGEKASGFHYGVNTCEACKGFFRRSLARKDTYRCSRESKCAVSGPGTKRSCCSYCRFHKCVAVGMSKTAIKTGRYTHEKRSKDIREVKRLQHKKEKGEELPLMRDEDVDEIVDTITELHLKQTPHTPDFFDRLPQKEEEFLKQRAIKEQVFGQLRALDHDEYMQIYRSTGLDVDGRRAMMQHILPCVEKAIKRLVAFSKALPLFKTLPLPDQMSLIKHARLDCWLITSHRSFNKEKQLFTEMCGYTMDTTTLCKLYRPDHLQLVFGFAERMQRLDLSISELCIFKGICILQNDRGHLEERDRVQQLQDLLIRCMERRAAAANRGRFFMPRMISLMTEMRTLSKYHSEWEETMDADWSSELPVPPLLYEFVGNS